MKKSHGDGTSRLLRQEFAPDWTAIHRYASKIEVVRYMDFGPNTVEDTKNFVNTVIVGRKQQPRRAYEFTMTLKEDGSLVGGCGLGIERHDQASLGYCLDRPYWGYGLMPPACGKWFRAIHPLLKPTRPPGD